MFIHPIFTVWKGLSSISKNITFFDIKDLEYFTVRIRFCLELFMLVMISCIYVKPVYGILPSHLSCGKNSRGEFAGKRNGLVVEFIIPEIVHIAPSMKMDLFLWRWAVRERLIKKSDIWNWRMFTSSFFIISLLNFQRDSVIFQSACPTGCRNPLFISMSQQFVRMQYLPHVASTAPKLSVESMSKDMVCSEQ